jgi:hypothetical protein
MRDQEDVEERLSDLLAKRSHMGQCKKKTQYELNGQIAALRWVLNDRNMPRKPKNKGTPKGTPTVGCCPELTEVYRRPMRPQY